jgi:hypothetical protein
MRWRADGRLDCSAQLTAAGEARSRASCRDRRMIRGFACDAAASTCRINLTPGPALTLTFARR